jgi:hypothetical protein
MMVHGKMVQESKLKSFRGVVYEKTLCDHDFGIANRIDRVWKAGPSSSSVGQFCVKMKAANSATFAIIHNTSIGCFHTFCSVQFPWFGAVIQPAFLELGTFRRQMRLPHFLPIRGQSIVLSAKLAAMTTVTVIIYSPSDPPTVKCAWTVPFGHTQHKIKQPFRRHRLLFEKGAITRNWPVIQITIADDLVSIVQPRTEAKNQKSFHPWDQV